MALTSARRLALEDSLAKMESALDNLILGQTPSEIRDQNGELIRFSVGNPEQARLALQRRIIAIKSQLGLPTGFCSPLRAVIVG